MKIKLFCILLIFTISVYPQGKSSGLQSQINKILSSEFFTGTQIAVDIFDLTSNKSLYRRNEKLLFHPASTIKLLTTSASLLFLDDFKFKTSLYQSGFTENFICNGDIYIAGGLDPDFSFNDLDSLVKEIKNSGINEIRGNIYADLSAIDSLMWGNGWMWDDDPDPNSPYLSALNINDNAIKILYAPGIKGKPALINTEPKTGFVEVINKSITTEQKNIPFLITRDWINRNNKIIVNGEIALNDKPDDLLVNIYNPAQYFLQLFKERLAANRISFNGEIKFAPVPAGLKEIFSLERLPDSVIVSANKESKNLSAEMLLRAMALKYYGKPASASNGIKLIDSLITLTGLKPENYRIADGSGLSFYNLVSAELLNETLKYVYMNRSDLFNKLLNSLSVAGVDGTLKDRMKKSFAYKKVNGKTGTISGVSNLSGFITNKSNHLIAFTVLIQNFTGSSKTAREIQDKICEIIYGY